MYSTMSERGEKPVLPSTSPLKTRRVDGSTLFRVGGTMAMAGKKEPNGRPTTVTVAEEVIVPRLPDP